MNVLLIGDAGGIGRATRKALQNSGYAVIGIDQRRSSRPSTYAVDVRDVQQVTRVCTQIAKSHRPLWGIVYCAGVYPLKTVEDYSALLFDDVFKINVTGAFLFIQKLSRVVVDGGRVVLMASAGAYTGSRDPGYAASKAAVLGLTKSFARTLATRGVLVNAIAPGLISTPMSSRMPVRRKQGHIEATLLKRPGRPAEVAAVIAFLLEHANSYMTGSVLDVSGGLHCR